MNQMIQVLDGYTYSNVRQALKIEVMHAGHILPCYVGGASESYLVELYENHQFSIEDVIEQQLENDNINDEGELCFDASIVILS